MSYHSELAYEKWEQANFCAEEEPLQEEAIEEPEDPASIPQPAEPVQSQPAPVPEDDEAVRRQAHEAAEARRRSEWDAAQKKKHDEEQDQLNRIANMDEDALRLEAIQRISSATDKMTNRSMKESVSAHIREKCEQNPAFARLALHPRKSMLHCIQYIYRQAKDYLQKEMEAQGIKHSGMYGGDVPDGLCYQWAEDYFKDPAAKEDQDTEQFTPRPYISHKPAAPKPVPKPAPKPKGCMDGQISLLGAAS